MRKVKPKEEIIHDLVIYEGEMVADFAWLLLFLIRQEWNWLMTAVFLLVFNGVLIWWNHRKLKEQMNGN